MGQSVQILEQELARVRRELDMTNQEYGLIVDELRQKKQDYHEQRIAAINIAKDVEEARRLLQERTDELIQSNADLEQYAYIASHDLHTPLRHLSSFTHLLADKLSEHKDEEINEYITRILDSVKRMDNMIQDLLNLSRLGRKSLNYQRIDLSERLNSILHELEEDIQNSGANISEENLGFIYADGSLVDQLFQNLIGNALKFRRPNEKIDIKVSCETQKDGWVISVSDNGIGIEKRFQDRIFNIFQRLHNRSDYPGTGIGLALCKRIVTLHGGKIGVESSPDWGSRFYFSIPKVFRGIEGQPS